MEGDMFAVAKDMYCMWLIYLKEFEAYLDVKAESMKSDSRS